MANKCVPNLKNGQSSKNNLKRNNYFKGKLLTAKDFNDEQDYLTDKIRRLSHFTNGSGVIEGLKVSAIKENKIYLTPGAAIDTHGNLLYLHQETSFELPRALKEKDYIYLHYIERENEKVSLQNEEECSEDCCFNKIEEDCEIILHTDLLTATPKDICSFEYKNENKESSPKQSNDYGTLVLIGQRKKGGTNYAKVNTLYKNSELSQRLCQISKKYVSSVNGQSGDVSAITTINGVTSDVQGDINFIAGNNITFSSDVEAHTVMIESSNGFYHDYYVTIESKESLTINHKAKRFPVVDIYKREINASSAHHAVKDTELKQQAKDTGKPIGTLKSELGAKTLEEYISQNKTGTTSANSWNMTTGKVSDVLAYDLGITMSPQVMKMSNLEIKKVVDIINVLPNYQYTKVIGSENSGINVEITHLNINNLKLTNNSSKKVSLLVIVST